MSMQADPSAASPLTPAAEPRPDWSLLLDRVKRGQEAVGRERAVPMVVGAPPAQRPLLPRRPASLPWSAAPSHLLARWALAPASDATMQSCAPICRRAWSRRRASTSLLPPCGAPPTR